MATDEATTGLDGERQRESRLIPNVVWLLLLAAAWLVFELTANPALAAVVACGKFGWNDFRTGWWIRRTDPYRARGSTCFWFLLASGMWKITGTAIVLTFVLSSAVAAQQQGQPGGAQMNQLFGVLLFLMVFGPFLSTGATLLAIAFAWRMGVRIWIDRTLHWHRRNRVWPPRPWGENSIHRQITLSLGLVLLISTIVVIAVAFSRQPLPAMGEQIRVLTFAGSLVGGAAATLWLRERILRDVCARYSEECWMAGSIETDDAADYFYCYDERV